MGRVIVIGSINVDLESRIERYPQPGEKVMGESLARLAGGKGANQAVAARSQGADVVMVGAVGDDDAGRACLNRLFAHGIKLQVERIPQVPTGHALVFSDGSSNAIVVHPGANARLAPTALRAVRDLGEDDTLLTQLEIPPEAVIEAVRHARKYGARTVINLAPFTALPEDVIASANPLIIPVADLPAWEALGMAPASLIVLHGKDGLVWDGERIPGPIVPADDVHDTVGATDALVGALTAALAAGADHHAAAWAGLSAAAHNVRHAGAQPDGRL